MADTTIRWTCVQRTLDLARERPELAGVTVTGVYPGDDRGTELVYVGDLTGDLNVPLTRSASQRVIYDDEFDITWVVEVRSNGLTADQVMARADEIIGVLQDVIANDAQLDTLDGVVSSRLTRQEGPTGAEIRGAGVIAIAHLVQHIHSRLQ